MGFHWLSRALAFPSTDTADENGIVAIGGDCRVERLLLAYKSGIFPWPLARHLPLLWFSPDPRYVIDPRRAHIPRSLKKQVRRGLYKVTADTDFVGVIRACARVPREGQQGTWITQELRQGYESLHREGYAHSIEAWRDGALVGGLYGVSLGRAFFGESMFALEPDASKVAFTALLGNLVAWGFDLVDCQTRTDHLERFGAGAMRRRDFLAMLQASLQTDTRRGVWRLDRTPLEALALLQGSPDDP
ncbi:MAG: leucyl/phenylalanyl-tRNA--protein transferase [Deltaproteobacteria bacterium]|nr:leucyl/phenylalanyl-tRNA--protein transferase [Deltaproteobacteria bacterium]